METKVKDNNPILIKTPKMEALKEAYSTFLAIINDFAEAKNLSSEEKAELRALFSEAYTQKMLAYFLEAKLESVTEYLERSLTHRLHKQEGKALTNFLYMKHTKRVSGND